MLLYIFVPKGFFPVQDTGVILGISEAPHLSVVAMGARQKALAKSSETIRQSRACLVIVDGTTPPSTAAAFHHLKRRRTKKSRAVIRRCNRCEGSEGEPVPSRSGITVGCVSRTPDQYSLDDAAQE